MKIRKTKISLPELGLIAITRAFLGAGARLIIGERISGDQRKAVDSVSG